MEMSPKSLLEMARGAFLERFDYEVPKSSTTFWIPTQRLPQNEKSP